MSWDSQMGCTLFAPFGSPAASSSVPLGRGPWLCVPASRRVCLFVDVLVTTIYAIRRGKTSWKLRPGARADGKDEVAPDCERASFGLSTEEFFVTVPQSFFEGLAP